MIQILDKRNRCGCSACVQRCPKHCITLQEDSEGFWYPQVYMSTCIDCGLCEIVCLMLQRSVSVRKPIAIYAAKNCEEEIRRKSSSGGVFTALAEQIIQDGGVVFGACFNEKWEVMHTYTETIEGLSKFRGSKYVQSWIGNAYEETEKFLKADKKVLFSGTPCQIAGLKQFLRKDYEKLFTVDVICHGVPSPSVWREYLNNEITRQCGRKNIVLSRLIHEKKVLVDGVSFRDKKSGWKKYSFVLTLSTTNESGGKIQFCSRIPLNENLYMKGFLADLYLRPSCYACPVKCGKSGSNLTLGDFWGLQTVMPLLDDDKGMTALLVNDKHGQELLDKINVDLWQTDYESVFKGNPALEKSARIPQHRNLFFADTNLSFEKKMLKYIRPTLRQRIKRKIQKVGLLLLSRGQKVIIKKILKK